MAIMEHEKRGGGPHHVEVAEFIDTHSDTTDDAVECAATLAAWESLGHKAGAGLRFEEGRWVVGFAP